MFCIMAGGYSLRVSDCCSGWCADKGDSGGSEGRLEIGQQDEILPHWRFEKVSWELGLGWLWVMRWEWDVMGCLGRFAISFQALIPGAFGCDCTGVCRLFRRDGRAPGTFRY